MFTAPGARCAGAFWALRRPPLHHASRRALCSVIDAVRPSGAGLFWPEPWGRAFSDAGEPTLVDEADVTYWRYGAAASASQPDVWVRMTARRPAYRCPACGTAFERLRHFIGHCEITGHLKLPPFGVGGKWKRNHAPLYKLTDAERVPVLALLPIGAGFKWLCLPEHLLTEAEAAAENRAFAARLAREPQTTYSGAGDEDASRGRFDPT